MSRILHISYGLERIMLMEDGTMIPLDDILDIQSDLSNDWQDKEL